MATTFPSTSVQSPRNSFTPFKTYKPSFIWPPRRFYRFIIPPFQTQLPLSPLCSSNDTTAATAEDERPKNVEAMSTDVLRRFINLNLGNWTGSFHQFDCYGNLLHKISTKLAVGSYGEDELLSLIQTLYIKQPPIEDGYEPEWFEYKIKETNMFTVDKYQQFADRFLFQREGFCFEVSDSWNAGDCVKIRGPR